MISLIGVEGERLFSVSTIAFPRKENQNHFTGVDAVMADFFSLQQPATSAAAAYTQEDLLARIDRARDWFELGQAAQALRALPGVLFHPVIKQARGWGRASIYKALALTKILRRVPPLMRREIPLGNAVLLADLILARKKKEQGRRVPELTINAAMHLKRDAFVRFLKEQGDKAVVRSRRQRARWKKVRVERVCNVSNFSPPQTA